MQKPHSHIANKKIKKTIIEIEDKNKTNTGRK